MTEKKNIAGKIHQKAKKLNQNITALGFKQKNSYFFDTLQFYANAFLSESVGILGFPTRVST